MEHSKGEETLSEFPLPDYQPSVEHQEYGQSYDSQEPVSIEERVMRNLDRALLALRTYYAQGSRSSWIIVLVVGLAFLLSLSASILALLNW